MLICIASRPSPLLIMKGYLILTPFFSNQTRASTLTTRLHTQITIFLSSSPRSSQTLSLLNLSHSLIPNSYTPAPHGILQPCTVLLQSLPSLLLKVPVGHLQQHHHSSGRECGFLVGTTTQKVCLFLSFLMTLPAPPISGKRQ